MQRSSRIVYGLAALGLAVGSSSAAHAALQIDLDVSGSLLTCIDNAACDADPSSGVLRILKTILNGVELTEQSSVDMPAAILNTSLSFVNGTGSLKHVVLTVSDSGHVATVNESNAYGPGIWHIRNSSGWFAEVGNDQGVGNLTNPSQTLPSQTLAVPEPASFLLFGSSIGLGLIKTRRRQLG
jgi:hypothetical protein